MTSLSDPGVKALLDAPNHAVISTFAADGSVHSAVVWQEPLGDILSVNSAVGRRWPTELSADPRVTVVVMDQNNPYDYVEIRGTAQGSVEGADEQIDRLAKKYIDADTYPFHTPDEQRISFRITPERVRHWKQS